MRRFIGSTFLLTLFLFLTVVQVFAGDYRFDSWTTDSGLPQNGLREIAQTPDGFLWITTFDGLVRFDGLKFDTFNKTKTKGMISSRFTGIYCDKAGTLYITANEEGTLTIYRDGVFRSYTSDQVPGRYIEMVRPDKDGEIRYLTVDKDAIRTWYHLRDGKFVFDELANDHYVENRVPSGNLWQLTSEDVVESRPDGSSTVYQYKIPAFDHTQETFEAPDGALWIGGRTLARLKDGTIHVFGQQDGFPENADFHDFWSESDGSVWFANGGRAGEGVGLVRYKDGLFSTYGKELGLTNTRIYSVFRDREGVVWLATNKGLNRFRRMVISGFDEANGLFGNEAYPILRDHADNIWIGTSKGLTIYRDGKFEQATLTQSDPTAPEVTQWKNGIMSVQSLFEDSNGKMWIGIDGGLFVEENGQTAMLRDTVGLHVYAVSEDKDKNIWAATDKGIILYRDYQRKAFYDADSGLPNQNMNVIFQDSTGRLWFGGAGGLSEFKDGKFINHSTADGLSGDAVRSIYEDSEGVLWIGTYSEGLTRYKNGVFKAIRKTDGLFSDNVFAIQEDERGNFWISGNSGIYRVARRNLNDFADGLISSVHSVSYDKDDGMLNNECNGGRQPASIKDKDGYFWFPTQDGVVRVDSSFENYDLLPPTAVIASATIDGEEVDISGGLTIKPGQKEVEITYTGLSFVKSDQIRFKTKLDGNDADWIDRGTKRTATYANLAPGNYRFLVLAANSNGRWSEKAAVLNVTPQPFYYQTTEFFLLLLTLGVFALFIVWQISVHQLKARERKLARLVSEKTKELKKANDALQLLVNSDGLTNVGNRRLFEDSLTNEWNRSMRTKTPLSLILLDIDHFKLFNDTYGHQAGDLCLKQVAGALKQAISRPTDVLARFGGEEFAIVLAGTDSLGAQHIAEQAVECVRNLGIVHSKSETAPHVTVSIGLATTFVYIGMGEDGLIKAADEALYRAKKKGRNQISFSDLPNQIPNTTGLEEGFASIN